MKLARIQVMEQYKDNTLYLLVHCILHSSCWDVFAAMGHVLDNLEAPHDDNVESVAHASQQAFVTIEGDNNVWTTISHYCLVPPNHAQAVQLPIVDLLYDCSYCMKQKLKSKTTCCKIEIKNMKVAQQASRDA